MTNEYHQMTVKTLGEKKRLPIKMIFIIWIDLA